MRLKKAHWPVWAALLPLIPMAAARQAPFYLAPSLVVIMRFVWLAQEKLLARLLSPARTSWLGLFSLSLAGILFSDLMGLAPTWILSVVILGHVEGHSKLRNAAQFWVTAVFFLTFALILSEYSQALKLTKSPAFLGLLMGAAVYLQESVIYKLFPDRRGTA